MQCLGQLLLLLTFEYYNGPYSEVQLYVFVEIKQLRAILIIIPVSGGLLMLTCIITMVAVGLK